MNSLNNNANLVLWCCYRKKSCSVLIWCPVVNIVSSSNCISRYQHYRRTIHKSSHPKLKQVFNKETEEVNSKFSNNTDWFICHAPETSSYSYYLYLQMIFLGAKALFTTLEVYIHHILSGLIQPYFCGLCFCWVYRSSRCWPLSNTVNLVDSASTGC